MEYRCTAIMNQVIKKFDIEAPNEGVATEKAEGKMDKVIEDEAWKHLNIWCEE